MRRLSSNLLLTLLLVLLVLIYQARSTPAVLLLSMALLGAGLFLTATNQPRGDELLALMTASVSIIGVIVLGQEIAGNRGGACLAILWVLVLVLVALRWRVRVQPGQILLVTQSLSDRVLPLSQGLHFVPFIDQKLAVLPAHDTSDISLQQVPTRTGALVNQLDLRAHYRVEDAVRVWEELWVDQPVEVQSGKQGEQVNEALGKRWSELLRERVKRDIEQSVSETIGGIDDPSTVIDKRAEVEQKIRVHLQENVGHLGLRVTNARLGKVLVDTPYQQPSTHEPPQARTGETIPHQVLIPATIQLPEERPTIVAPSAPPPASTTHVPSDEEVQMALVLVEQLHKRGETISLSEALGMVQQMLGKHNAPSAQPQQDSAKPPHRTDDPLYGLSN